MRNIEIIHFTEVKGFCFKERTVIFNEENCNLLLTQTDLSNKDKIQCLYALYIDFAHQTNLLKSRNNHGDCNIKLDKTVFSLHHYVDTIAEKIKYQLTLENFNAAIQYIEDICDLNNTWRMASEINKKEKIANNLKLLLGLEQLKTYSSVNHRASLRI